MLGYVKAYQPELKVKELGIYKSYYCGLCRVIGERYGQMLRTALSYDMTFLAIVLASFDGKEDRIVKKRCAVHAFREQTMLQDEEALSYAADMVAILGYENHLDDVSDPGGAKRGPAGLYLKQAYRKAASRRPDAAAQIRASLADLYALEKKKERSIDRMADAFARVMADVFLGGRPDLPEGDARALREFAENLGRWIYVIDALDDLEEDAETGAYNPLHEFFTETENRSGKIAANSRIREQTGILLYHYLGRTSAAFDLMDIRKNQDLIRNIIYLGLRKETEDVLGRSSNGQ